MSSCRGRSTPTVNTVARGAQGAAHLVLWSHGRDGLRVPRCGCGRRRERPCSAGRVPQLTVLVNQQRQLTRPHLLRVVRSLEVGMLRPCPSPVPRAAKHPATTIPPAGSGFSRWGSIRVSPWCALMVGAHAFSVSPTPEKTVLPGNGTDQARQERRVRGGVGSHCGCMAGHPWSPWTTVDAVHALART
jgi:hypothetical protein